MNLPQITRPPERGALGRYRIPMYGVFALALAFFPSLPVENGRPSGLQLRARLFLLRLRRVISRLVRE